MSEWTLEIRAHLARLRLLPEREAEIVEELSQHLDDHRRDLISAGMSPEAATARIVAELENGHLLGPRLAALRQAHAPERIVIGNASRGMVRGFVQDLRFALRTLARQTSVTAVATLTLALGIGLNTAMFSFLNAVLLRPLPFPDPHRLVLIHRTTPQNDQGDFSWRDYGTLKQEEAGFGRVAAYERASLTPTEPGRPTEWLRASTDLFAVMGVQPTLGRTFRPDEEIGGDGNVVVISHAVWQDRFGGARDVVGRMLHADGEAYEVIGVLPRWASDYRLFGQAGIFSPLRARDGRRWEAAVYSIGVLARRDTAVSESQGNAFLATLAARSSAARPVENANTTWRAEELPTSVTGPAGRAFLFMLLGLSTSVLLIACSNLANVLLVRAIERSREFAVRVALGASRVQLVRPLALESLILAALGGSGALLVSALTTGWLYAVIQNTVGVAFDFGLDWRVLSFAVGISALTIVSCSIAPIFFAFRLNTQDSLKSGGRSATTSRGHTRLRHAFIVAQFSLALILLAGAGFLIRGTSHLLAQQHGWRADHVAQAEIRLPDASYIRPAEVAAFQRRVVERMTQLPGVISASVSDALPYLGLTSLGRYVLEERPGTATDLAIQHSGITASYFAVTGTRLIEGRAFTDHDTAESLRVAIVNETLARTFFPNGSPIGHRIAAAGATTPEWLEIVGVVGDVRSVDPSQAPVSFQLYQPTAQDPKRAFICALRTSDVPPESILPSVRVALTELDPNLSVRNLKSADQLVAQVTSQMGLFRTLMIAFAVLGVSLAALGIYGVIARVVAQRTSEIGIRMALGATLFDIRRLILSSGALLAMAGATIGLFGALALAGLLASVLPMIQTDGALVITASVVALVTVALFACYVPASRAATIDPAVALRSE